MSEKLQIHLKENESTKFSGGPPKHDLLKNLVVATEIDDFKKIWDETFRRVSKKSVRALMAGVPQNV